MSDLFEKNNRRRNQDGTFKKDVGWTPWNEAWSYKMSDSFKDMLEKTIWTFIEAFIGALVVSPLVGVDANAITTCSYCRWWCSSSCCKRIRKKTN